MPTAARLVALGTVLMATSCGGATTHRDGEGPMTSLKDPEGFSRMAIDPQLGVDTWSFGMPLCLEESGTSVTLHSVEPSETVGSGFEFVGAAIHEYTISSGETGIISVDRYPPAAEVLIPIEDYVFELDCTAGQDRGVELVVGLTMTNDDGGGWLGTDVSYSVGDRDYVLQIHNEMLICAIRSLNSARGRRRRSRLDESVEFRADGSFASVTAGIRSARAHEET